MMRSWFVPAVGFCLLAGITYRALDEHHKARAALEAGAPAARTCGIAEDDPVVQRFARSLTYQTVGDNTAPDHIRAGYEPHFDGFLAFLETSFPEVYSKFNVERVGLGGWTRLYTWQGTDASLLPILFISHYDVVPVDPASVQDWTYGPFQGQIADGCVWGRGALDIKFGVMALLEAATRLLQDGFQPQRTLMFTFGHDEELGGTGGAAKVADLLQQRGVQLDAIIDEGGVISADGLPPFMPKPVALVATAEKQYTSVRVTLKSAGGHSSMPPIDGSDVGSQFARLLTAMRKQQPPAELQQPMVDFLHGIAPYAPPLLGTIMRLAHTGPVRWLLATALGRASSESNALVRTTAVATRIQAGVADNVLPNTGHITFNMRSHPSVPRADVVQHVREVLHKAGLRGEVEVTNATFDGPEGQVTPSGGRHFQLLKQAIQEYWRHGDQAVAVVPFIVSGGTDSKWYAGLSQHGILRFVPYQLSKSAGELATIHSTNERARVADYVRAICTYQRILELMSAAPGQEA